MNENCSGEGAGPKRGERKTDGRDGQRNRIHRLAVNPGEKGGGNDQCTGSGKEGAKGGKKDAAEEKFFAKRCEKHSGEQGERQSRWRSAEGKDFKARQRGTRKRREGTQGQIELEQKSANGLQNESDGKGDQKRSGPGGPLEPEGGDEGKSLSPDDEPDGKRQAGGEDPGGQGDINTEGNLGEEGGEQVRKEAMEDEGHCSGEESVRKRERDGGKRNGAGRREGIPIRHGF